MGRSMDGFYDGVCLLSMLQAITDDRVAASVFLRVTRYSISLVVCHVHIRQHVLDFQNGIQL